MATTNEEEIPSTLYPKITGKLRDLTDAIRYNYAVQESTVPQSIPFIGTVKLHGTHADILVDAFDHITYQSRNRIDITPESDNQGFAAFCASRGPRIKRLFASVRERWRELHASDKLGDGSIVLAGEWIGQNVPRGVAISQLSRRFVVCGIQINGVWEPMERYVDIADEEAAIVNISRGGFYHLDLELADDGARFMEAAKKLTLEVEASCPFGRAMGVEGPGEGIVWVPAPSSVLPNTAALWLKTKGEHFAATNSMPNILPDHVDRRARAKAFAAAACTKSRLEQGWQYLEEMGIERSMKGYAELLRWEKGD